MERTPLLETDGVDSRRSLLEDHENRRASLTHKQSYGQLPCPVVGYYGDNYQSIIPPPRRPSQSSSVQSDSRSEEVFIDITIDKRKHKPYFIYTVSVINVALMIWSFASGGVEDIGFSSDLESKTFPRFGYGIKTLNESLSFYPGRNFFIGPNASYFVKFGAMYSPCIRPDTAIRKMLARQAREEQNYSCCSLNGECGMRNSCQAPGIIIDGRTTNCSSVRDECELGVTVRPCCLGLHAKCIIASQEQCQFLRGEWHNDKLLCSEVTCLDGICGGSVTEKAGGGQGYRLMTAIFIHLGLLHVLFNLLFQVIIGRMIEIEIGTIRTACIYLISGLGGSLVSGIFTPLTPQVGSSGALFGLVALILVHYVHYYHSLRRPFWDLCVLIVIIVFSFALGTLPYIGNFVHLGGFVFGLLATLTLARRGTAGWVHRTAHRYWCIKLVSAGLLVTLTAVFFAVLYNTKDTEFCPNCHVIDCIPWTKNFCPDMTSDGLLN